MGRRANFPDGVVIEVGNPFRDLQVIAHVFSDSRSGLEETVEHYERTFPPAGYGTRQVFDPLHSHVVRSAPPKPDRKYVFRRVLVRSTSCD